MGFDRTITSEQRQGQYSSTRYHGKYNFGTTGYNPDTMILTTAKLYLTATASGKSAARPLWLRAGSSTISPIIAKSNGDKYSVNRQATNEINLLNANSNAETALKNGYFGMYVSSSYDDYYFKTSSGVKYSTHYIKFSKARLLLEWVYKNGTLNLDSTSVNIGSSGGSLTATVGNYQSNYYYRLIVSVGNVTQSYNMGTTSSKSINFANSTWKNAVTNGLFANATSILGTITLQTYSDSNYTVQLGSDSSVPVTFIGTGLEAPTITNVTVSYTNSGSYTSIKDFAISGSGTITVNYTATGQQGSSIISQNVSSISTFTSSINSSIITLKPDTSVASGTYYFTLSVTDSRGKITQTTFSVIVKKYTGPTVNITTVSRVIVNGVEQISVQYSTSFFTGTSFKTGGIIITDANNEQILEEKLTSASGTYTTNIDGGISEVEHKITIFIIDSWSTRDSDDKTLVSSTYYLFFGVQKNDTVENGISLGIGGAASNESNTVYSHWDLKLKNPLDTEYGGTGASNQSGAWTNIVAPGGTITGNLTIKKNPVINSSAIWNVLHFKPTTHTTATSMGEICYQTGNTGETTYSKSRFIFRQHSYDSSSVPSSTVYEDYRLPDTPLNLGVKSSYDILTTKTVIYWDGSGTEPAVINGGIMLKKI